MIDRPARPGDYREMSFARWALILPIVWGVQVAAQDTSAPTPLEQALIEHVCNASRVAGAVESGAYQNCLSLKLASIRADFGRDLSKLSVSDRKTIDSACSKVLETRDRDAYVECLSGQLMALSSRRSSATPAPSAAASLPPPTSASSANPPSSPPELSSPSSLFRIGFGIAIVLVGAGGAFIIMRRRRAPTVPTAPSTCRVCGAAVPQPGGLCERCRREAAGAARRASAERVDQAQKNLEELRQQKARQEEDARQREQQRARQQQEEAQEQEANRRQDEVRRREGEARRATQATAAPAREEFDPYAILGVSRDATTEQIRAAYDEAMSKYDLTHVDHLGPELQEHYKTKAEAVERAFLMLTR